MKSKRKYIHFGVSLKTKNYQLKTERGFSLVEMIVSFALFSFTMLAVTSVLLGVIDANQKARGMKTTVNNLSLTLESIARNLRVGGGYGCDGIVGVDCPSSPAQKIVFTDYNGVSTLYCLNGGAIRVAKNGAPCDGTAPALTAPGVTVDRLDFYVSGASNIDLSQPRILIVFGGVVNVNTSVGAKIKTSSRFDIQTMVSGRDPDVPQT